ncbi:MAG TPA: hypothetical protein VNC84_03300 [Gammaproteobacteria bacterium]|jgi:hypothetical protein|nr:hypothetical protein [Gammaproteobacteria bacterium]
MISSFYQNRIKPSIQSLFGRTKQYIQAIPIKKILFYTGVAALAIVFFATQTWIGLLVLVGLVVLSELSSWLIGKVRSAGKSVYSLFKTKEDEVHGTIVSLHNQFSKTTQALHTLNESVEDICNSTLLQYQKMQISFRFVMEIFISVSAQYKTVEEKLEKIRASQSLITVNCVALSASFSQVVTLAETTLIKSSDLMRRIGEMKTKGDSLSKRLDMMIAQKIPQQAACQLFHQSHQVPINQERRSAVVRAM